jgi:CRISPR-associated protein Cas2
MVMILLERAPSSLRGHLTRWLLELRAGVFVGTVSALVRDELWDLCRTRVRSGAAMLIHTAQNEQGFAIKVAGQVSREVVDLDGLQLIRVPLRGDKDPSS